MSREIVATHEYDSKYNSGTVDLMKEDGQYFLATNSPCGETCIYFDEVKIGRRTITFYKQSDYGKSHYKTGSIEGSVQDHGNVGEWLTEFEKENTPPTYAL